VDELRKLAARHSVVVEAPRRFGKTSVIKEFVRQEREKGNESRFSILFLELEGGETLDQFCLKLYRELINLYDIRRYGEWLKTILHDSWNAVASRVPSVGVPEFELGAISGTVYKTISIFALVLVFVAGEFFRAATPSDQ